MAIEKTGYLKLTVAGVLCLLISIVALLFIFRIYAVQLIGKLALNSLGFEDVILTVDQITLDNLHIKNLSLDKTLQVQDVIVRYHVQSLLKGEIQDLEIGALDADLSNPQEGAIEKLVQLIKSSDSNTQSEKTVLLPSISLKQGRLFADTRMGALQANIDGTLSPELIFAGNIRLAGNIQNTAGPVLLENLQIFLRADLAAQTANVKFEGGMLRHGVEVADWAPLSIFGGAAFADNKAIFDIDFRTVTEQSLLKIEGAYDNVAKSGTAALKIQSLVFNRKGLQPSDLIRQAGLMPPFDGVLTTNATVNLKSSKISYDIDIDMSAISLEQKDVLITAAIIPLRVTGTYLLGSDEQQATLTLPDTQFAFVYDNKTYLIHDLKSAMDISNLAGKIELRTLSGSVEHVGKNPDFIPFDFHAVGKADFEGLLTIEGDVSDRKKRLILHMATRQNLNTGKGSISLGVAPTKIGQDGLRLSTVSSFLKSIPEELSGIIDGRIELGSDLENGIDVISAAGGISKAAFSKDNLDFENLSLRITAEQQQADGDLHGNVQGNVGEITLNDQKFSVLDLNAEFQTSAGLAESGNLVNIVLKSLEIKPKGKAFLKESLSATGSARLKKEQADFEIAIASDILGNFTKVKGQHSFKSMAGSARVDISPLFFIKETLQPSDLVRIVDPTLILTGQIESEGRVSWSSKGVKSTAKLELVNISVKTEGSEISGLNGVINIDELSPLTISEFQELTSSSAFAGILLQQPSLRFRVLTKNGSPILYVDRMTVGLVGGVAIIEDAILDTGAEVNRVTVQLSSLNLEEVMALGDVEELSATGGVSGQIPLIFDGEKILIDTGLLEADGPGELKMKSESARQALAGGGDQTKLLFDILENFQYSDLSIKIKKTKSGEDTVSLHAAGGNPDIENNRPVVLNINLTTSLDKIFNTILDGYLLSEKALRATVKGRRK